MDNVFTFLLVLMIIFQQVAPAVIKVDDDRKKDNDALVKATCSGKKTGFYAHPTSCSSYISCDERGTNQIEECKPHNHFHPEYRVCVWEEIYYCSGDTPDTGAAHMVEFCKSKTSGNYPDSTRCDSYIICSDEGAYRMKCPKDLLFNSLTNQCDEEDNIICDADVPVKTKGICDGKKPGNYRSLTNCNEYVACTGSSGIHMKCLEGLWFNQQENRCEAPGKVKCAIEKSTATPMLGTASKRRVSTSSSHNLDDFNLIIAINYSIADGSSATLSCKGMSKGNYSVKGACQHYYYCSDGGDAKLMKCPKHKNFHPVYQSCVWTYLYSCDEPNFCKSKKDGKYQNMNNCYGYYHCSGGLTFPRNCTPGWRFNGDQCVDASEYVCPKSSKIRVDVIKRR